MTFAFLIIFQSAKPTSPHWRLLVDEPNQKQRTLGIVVCSTQPSAIQKGKKWIRLYDLPPFTSFLASNMVARRANSEKETGTRPPPESLYVAPSIL